MIKAPIQDSEEVFLQCISLVKDKNLKKRLVSISGEIKHAGLAYEEKASEMKLYSVLPKSIVGRDVNRKEMSAIYKQRMAKPNAPGREVYDKLLLAPLLGRCPLCGFGKVTTLDHYLPQAHYCAYAVLPKNLVPACADCNKYKRDVICTKEETQTLHPYFDTVDTVSWLVAEVMEVLPVAIRFYIIPSSCWSKVLAARVNHHFITFQLERSFALNAADELQNIYYSVKKLFDTGGAPCVQSHLKAEAESRRVNHLNSWQTAMYEALASNKWFCSGNAF